MARFYNIKDFWKNKPIQVKGFLVPKEFILHLSLAELEKAIGFERRRLEKGAAIAQLLEIPPLNDLEYFGDTRKPEHRFEEYRNKTIDRKELSKAAYSYFRPTTKLLKVIPIKGDNPMLSDDENYPSGGGLMQFKLINEKQAMVIDIIQNYPNGRVY